MPYSLLSHILILFAILPHICHNAIGNPVVYDYDYESWKDPQVWQIRNPPRRYRNTPPPQMNSLAPGPMTTMSNEDMSDHPPPLPDMMMMPRNPNYQNQNQNQMMPNYKNQMEMDRDREDGYGERMRPGSMEMGMNGPMDDTNGPMEMEPQRQQNFRPRPQMIMNINNQNQMNYRENQAMGNMRVREMGRNNKVPEFMSLPMTTTSTKPPMSIAELIEKDEPMDVDGDMEMEKNRMKLDILRKDMLMGGENPAKSKMQMQMDMDMQPRRGKSQMRKAGVMSAGMPMPMAMAMGQKEMPRKMTKAQAQGKVQVQVMRMRKNKKKVEEVKEEETEEEGTEEESKSKEDDIVPVLKALGLPADFASGTTTSTTTTTTKSPKKVKNAKQAKQKAKTTTTIEPATEEDEEEEDDDEDKSKDDNEEDDEEEDDDNKKTTALNRRPQLAYIAKPTSVPSMGAFDAAIKTANLRLQQVRMKNAKAVKTKAARTKSVKSKTKQVEARKPQVVFANAGEGQGWVVSYGDPPYGPDNPGPGDVYAKDANWKGLQKGGVTGQVLRMMLGIPGKSISVLKPLVVGSMDTGGQTWEAKGTLLEQAAKELPVVFHQAGTKTDEMFKKAGDLTGGALHIAGGLVNTAAGIKNSLSGTLPLLFDGAGDMLGGLTGQVGQLIDFISGLNDMATEGIVKAGKAGGNLLSGFVEGKKAHGTGVLAGIKYGLNNEPIPGHEHGSHGGSSGGGGGGGGDGEGGYRRRRKIKRRSSNGSY